MAKARPYGSQNGYDKPVNKQSAGRKFDDAVFIKRELNASEQAACKAQAFTVEQFAAQLEALMSQGYKVTFKWDDYSRSNACWISTGDKEHVNYGYILSGRGSTAQKALKQALYKHFNCCADGVWAGMAGDLIGDIDD